jgi:hypothetical protein
VEFLNSLNRTQTIDFYQEVPVRVKYEIWSDRIAQISISKSISVEQASFLKKVQAELSEDLFLIGQL